MKPSNFLDNLDDDAKEFILECSELLDSAESDLLSLDHGGTFDKAYASVFRVFHSLKGGAGMFGLKDLNHHMHQLENQLTQCGQRKNMTPHEVSFFLSGIDGAKKLLTGEFISFDYNQFNNKPKVDEQSVEPIAPATPTVEVKNVVSIVANREEPKRMYDGQVMIIDDEQEILDIIKDMLQDSNINAHCYTNPHLAIEEFKTIAPDIILTDMKMPQMSGLEVLKKIKALDPDTPVLYLSANLDKKTLIESINLGIYAALEKPFKESHVISTITSAIKISKMFKLIGKSIHLMLYQFADLEDFMISKGQNHQIKLIKNELQMLIDYRKSIREEKKAS